MTPAPGVPDPPRLRAIRGQHPEWPVVLAAAAAWAFLAARPHPHAGHHVPAHGGGVDGLGLAAMVVAMMLPLTLAGVREAARSAPRPRRAVAKFLAGYLGVWMPAMLLIDIAWRQLFAAGTGAAAGTMFLAALWELTPAKQRQGRGCGTGTPPGAGHFRTGVAAGGACVASCWALMAVCVAFAHDVRVMAALFCIQLVARYRPSVPPVLAALAVLAVCLASLALRIAGAHVV
jgi:predicted metal-binding membrane protein